MRFSVPLGEHHQILDGSQSYFTLISIEEGAGLLHIGGYEADGFPFAMSSMRDRRIVLPPGQDASIVSNSLELRGSVGQYGEEI